MNFLTLPGLASPAVPKYVKKLAATRRSLYSSKELATGGATMKLTVFLSHPAWPSLPVFLRVGLLRLFDLKVCVAFVALPLLPFDRAMWKMMVLWFSVKDPTISMVRLPSDMYRLLLVG